MCDDYEWYEWKLAEQQSQSKKQQPEKLKKQDKAAAPTPGAPEKETEPVAA